VVGEVVPYEKCVYGKVDENEEKKKRWSGIREG